MIRFGQAGTLFGSFLISRVDIGEDDARRLRECTSSGPVLYVLKWYGESEYALLDHVLRELHLPVPSVHVPPSVLGETENWLSSRLVPSDPSTADLLYDALSSGYGAVVALLRRAGLLTERMAAHQELVALFGRLAREGTDVTAIPVVPIWGRPLVRKELPLESLLGTDDSPGLMRKAGAFLTGGMRPTIRTGEPVKLSSFLGEDGAEASCRRFESAMLAEMDAIWHAALGPKITPRRKVQERLLNAPEIKRAVEREVESGRSPREVKAELIKAVEEIPADPSLGTVAVFKKALEVLWKLLYTEFEVDRDGLRRLAEAQKEGPLLLVPAHRSHVDYLVLSWIMEKYGISLPYVAAGRNLSFWPLGPLFRGGGAFFIRRTMKGDRLYRAVLKEYLAQVMRDGINVEFFIEGGRSRTGKVLYPKTGLLALIAELLQEGRIPDPVVAPLSLGYEKVIEIHSYVVEGEGKPKEEENIAQLVKATKVLLDEYGGLNIQVGREFRLSEGLGDAEPGTEPFRKAVEATALRIITEVALSTLVTPSMVAAASLLVEGGNVVELASFRRHADVLLDILHSHGVRRSSSLILHPHDSVDEALSILSGVERKGDRAYVAPSSRMALNYYKNGLLSPLGGLALGALAMEAGGDEVTAIYLWKIMRRELPHTILSTPQHLLDQARSLGPQERLVMARLLTDILEGQMVTLEELAHLMKEEDTCQFSSMVGRIKKRLDARARKGEFRRPEAGSVYVIQETLQWAADEGLIQRIRDAKKDEVRRVAPPERILEEVESRRAILLRVRGL